MKIKDLGCVTNLEVINRFVDLAGRYVIDAGCGAMGFTKQLVEQGASVLAIDPDSVQAQKNRDDEPIDGITFMESGAETLPVDDASVDGVFFAYSLHHVPAELYLAVFEEVLRVLKDDGFLYVIEPTDCPLNQVMKQFHDEEVEKAAAQTAMTELAKPNFARSEIVTYTSWRQFESFEDFATQFASKSFNSLYSEADVRSENVRLLFEKHGSPDYRFAAPKQVNFYEGKIVSN